MKARTVIAVQGIAALTCAFALMGGSASAAPGDISTLGGSNDYCVTETGADSDGNANGCLDGKGLTNGVSALQVTPDGKRLHVLGFDGFLNPIGDSITTYDRSPSRGSVTVDPRINACRSAAPVVDCSTGGSMAAFMKAPTGLAISPDSNQVYVSARRDSAVTVFDYVAVPDDPSGQQGPLTRKAAPNGCVKDAAAVECADAKALANASDVVMSPDGNTVYTAGRQVSGGGIAVFDRGANGVLTQKVGTAACVNDVDTGNGCADGSHLEPLALAITDDGKSLYAASYSNPGLGGVNNSVTAFDINPDDTITQKAGQAGCFTETGSGGDCTQAPGLNQPVDISVTPDGKNVYVASDIEENNGTTDIGTMTVFNRDITTGALTRPAGAAGCFAAEGAHGCTEADGLYRPFGGMAATDDAVYVGSTGRTGAPGALVVLNRDPSNGSLGQTDAEDCWASDELTGCVELSTLGNIRSIAVSPDGDSLYAGGDAITIFNRNDGNPPDTTIESGPPGESSSTDATFTFSSDKPDLFFECAIDNGPYQECASPKVYNGLSVADHIFRVRATDMFEQSDPTPAEQSFAVVKETDPPETTITSGPSGPAMGGGAAFTFSSDEPGTFECRMDSQSFANCASPKSYSGLAIGSHTFQVRATDTAGNVDPTPAQQTFAVPREPVGPDDTKVDAKVTATKVQNVKGKKILVAVKVKANEALTAKASGSIKKGKKRAAFKAITKKIPAGSTTTLKLKPAKAGQGRLVAAALLGSKRTVPKVIIVLTDGAQNRLVVKPKVKVKGAKR